jgi:hypothetical protein
MFIRHLAALAAVCVLGAPGAAAAQTWSDWGEADARTLVTAENGVVDEVARLDDGTIEVYATFDGWLKVMIMGKDCNGRGAALRCKRMAFNALFEIDDAARARELESELAPNFVADMADGEDYVIERAIELTGGVNLANLRAQLDRFISTCEQVTDVAWPSKDAAPTGKTRQGAGH